MLRSTQPAPRRARVAAAILTGLVAAPALAGEGGSWEPWPSLNTARQETCAAALARKVYVAGGLIVGGQATATVEVFGAGGDAWSFVAPMPGPRDHAAMVALDGRLYVIGGYGGDFQPRSTVFSYDPAADRWETSEPLPEPIGAGAAVSLGGRAYHFGGVGSGGVLGATWIFDPVAGEWTRGADMPTPREHLVAVASGGAIHVLGGRAGGSSTGAHERYDPATDTWEQLAPMPTARSAMSAAALGRLIAVAGGEVPRLFGINEIYDTATDTWSSQRDMTLPRHGAAAVALPGGMLVPGGGRVQGIAPTAVVDIFRAGPVLRLTGACPGAASLELAAATPGAFQGFFLASDLGTLIVPPGRPCAGAQIDLADDATLVGAPRADGGGEISIPLSLPPGACGRFVQVLDSGTCLASNALDF